MSEWHPIEIAPKDGTLILCVQADGSMFVGAYKLWIEGTEGRGDFYRWRAILGSVLLFKMYDSGDSAIPLDLKPTHWMPLPEPPK